MLLKEKDKSLILKNSKKSLKIKEEKKCVFFTDEDIMKICNRRFEEVRRI